MMSDDWYYKELEIDLPSLNKPVINWQQIAISNLTNHKLYGKLCNWRDIVNIYLLKRHQILSSQNYILQSYYFYIAYKIAFTSDDIKISYLCIQSYYNTLLKIKKKQTDIYMLLNAFRGLDCDIISVIKHYNRLLFLFY